MQAQSCVNVLGNSYGSSGCKTDVQNQKKLFKPKIFEWQYTFKIPLMPDSEEKFDKAFPDA